MKVLDNICMKIERQEFVEHRHSRAKIQIVGEFIREKKKSKLKRQILIYCNSNHFLDCVTIPKHNK